MVSDNTLQLLRSHPHLLQRVVMRRKAAVAQRTNDALHELLEKLILLEGKKGKGKTLSAHAIAWSIREKFNRPVVMIGSKMGTTPAFGEFKLMDLKEFKVELERISQMALSEDAAAWEVCESFKKYGISILGSITILDEAYKLFDARKPSDNLVITFGYFVAQMRHYRLTMMLTAPFRNMIDKRVLGQVDWFGRCYHPKNTDSFTVRFTDGVENWPLDINGAKYYPMYDTHTIVGYRSLKMKV